MPIIEISSVKEQTRTSGKGNKYKVVVVEGTKYGTNGEEWSTNIFKNQTDLLDMLDEFGPGEMANFKFKKNGKFWDLQTIEAPTEENLEYAANPTPSSSPNSGVKKSSNGMSKEEWAEKDRLTKESIARAVAVKLAMDNTKMGTKPDVIIKEAVEYLPYLLGVDDSYDNPFGDPLDPPSVD